MIQLHSITGRANAFISALLIGATFMLGSLPAQSAIETETPELPAGTEVMPLSGLENNHLGPLYVCPMHADEVSNKPGSCSQCGMFLVQQKQAAKDSNAQAEVMPGMNQQERIYVCPMHPDETSDKPGSCSQCGMFLVAQEGNVDHSMHKHSMPASNSGKHTKTMTDAAMQHGKMPMPLKDKPALFWESSEPQAGRETQAEHEHMDPVQGTYLMSKRMTPEPPMMSATAKPIQPEKLQELAGKHQEATYICPMHPQIVSKDADSACPICGMDLVAKKVGQNSTEHVHDQEEIYICPMHPQIVQDESGNCPICGMDLVPRKSAAPTGDQPQVFLSAAVIQNMGVRTARAQRKVLSKQIRTQGIVTPDDDRIIFIHPRTGGWIETLYPITEGERVERKDVLANFYSPWINQVQLDFIAALEEYDLSSFDPSKKAEVNVKLESLRNSLRLLNVMDMDIMRIKNSRKVQNTIQLMAPQGGIITQLGVREGTYVEPYQSMFTIVDLSQVWVMMDIYEYQAPWIRKGHQVKITAPAIPGRHWNGVIDFIYPEVDSKTRTLRARIAVPNPDEALLLNMFVQIDLSASASKESVLTVPREAVIVTGEREVVVKSLGRGHFQPVDVTTGTWGGHQAEILSGLKEGDDVVVSGQFLIDSESSLQASFLRMAE
ncbi:MAG: efflux RND transporter periplasmic adaptor subunit [Gammaproteobacteria bacterium]|nr:efflux RND transporter periplasmic adaptor subunit [Gammaproteobacteria bacterium]